MADWSLPRAVWRDPEARLDLMERYWRFRLLQRVLPVCRIRRRE